MLASGAAAAFGYAIGDDLSPDALAFVLAFAGGAVLTMLADTMMPEAFRHAGRLAGLVTTIGFAFAFVIGALQ
jgi:ZIP family zinc transporter